MLEEREWYYLDRVVYSSFVKSFDVSIYWLEEIVRRDDLFRFFVENFDEIYRYAESSVPKTYAKKVLRGLEFLRDNVGRFRETYNLKASPFRAGMRAYISPLSSILWGCSVWGLPPLWGSLYLQVCLHTEHPLSSLERDLEREPKNSAGQTR